MEKNSKGTIRILLADVIKSNFERMLDNGKRMKQRVDLSQYSSPTSKLRKKNTFIDTSTL